MRTGIKMMKRLALAAALAALPISIALTAPAAAQPRSYTGGSYWSVTGIKLKEGGGETYLDWLAGKWKAQSDFAKSKGWLEDYVVLSNDYPREGEPDLYLIRKFKSVPDAAEQERRDVAMQAFTKMDAHQAEAEAATTRTPIREVKSILLLQELKLK
jgi:hypothetical protein